MQLRDKMLPSRTADKMTPQEFVHQFVELYRRARVPPFPDEDITRARCRSVSGGLEDLAATYIARNMHGRYRIFVDQPVYINGRHVRYPDLVLYEKHRLLVCSFVDIKTDLGWKRARDKINAMCAKLQGLANAMAGREVMLGPDPKARHPHQVAAAPGCHLVVGAWPNSGKTTPDEAAAIARNHGVKF